MSFKEKRGRGAAVGGLLALAAAASSLLAGGGTAALPGAGECVDMDGDGFGRDCPRGPDCNDVDPARNPDATEACDFVDNNCNAVVDEGCPARKVNAGSRAAVKAGAFVMGSPDDVGSADEHPAHTVSLSKFWIDQFEVTVGRYQGCVKAGACTPPEVASSRLRASYYKNPAFTDYPVIHVDWYQAAQFCAWRGGRLPTEAEWEKSARGEKGGTTWPWGGAAPDCSKANFGGLLLGCIGDTDLVGRRTGGASPYGVMDLAGNVWEWVRDWYDSLYYAQSPATDPPGPSWGSFKVIRGGCFDEGPDNIRAACRASKLPTMQADNVGFRCAYDKK